MFEIILFGSVVLCAVVMLLCKYVFKGVPHGGNESIPIADFDLEPWYLDYARSFFPVLLIVFILRGFIAEPFRIPSGSMLPTLEVGDFILVNKYKYGLRLPITHDKVLTISEPKRGDIMVFRYPGDNKTNYIKRVIGLPGDTVEYRHKQLILNGQVFDAISDGKYTPFSTKGTQRALNRYSQRLPDSNEDFIDVEFSILLENRSSSGNISVTVPEGHYFVLGDNRDNSLDSRFWRFVPDDNVVGKAFFIWFHLNTNPGGGFKFSRLGEDI